MKNVLTVARDARPQQIRNTTFYDSYHVKPMHRIDWSKVKSWVRNNKRLIALSIVLFVVTTFIFPIAFLFGILAIIEKETMLKPLVEAEATILGFFGLIIVYALTSYDTRIDRLEQQKSEWTREKQKEQVANVQTQINKIVSNKRRTAYYALVIGIYFFLAFLLSILVLGITNIGFAGLIIWFAMMLFFNAIEHFFILFYFIASEPKTIPTEPTKT